MENNHSQQTVMNSRPVDEHKVLNRLVGDWTYEAKAVIDPDEPAKALKGVENVRSLGGLWIIAESKGEMPDGGEASMIMTLGYNPQKKRYVGTLIGSMMTHLWQYEGEIDGSGNMLTLYSEGPHMVVEGITTRYKDIIEFEGEDLRVLTSLVQDEDGIWQKFMTAYYRRRK
jgi:hypothetical protein